MKRLIIVAALTLGIVLATGIVWAVQLTLNSDDVARVGGTGMVDVLSPENDNTINAVAWLYDTSFDITGAVVTWEPAEAGSYEVAVIVYDNAGLLVTFGNTTETVADTQVGTPVNTQVTFNPAADPSQIYKVEVVIIQQQP